jgi:hypothetical protein
MDESEKAAAALEIQRLIEDRDSQLAGMSRDIIVSEMAQGDNFTKRARPAIVYTGLFAIVFNYVVVPFINQCFQWHALQHATGTVFALNPLDLPEYFWVAWGSVCSVWSLGRTAEKMGARNKVVDMITGNGKKGQ